MRTLLLVLRRSDRRIVITVIVLFLCVCFAIFEIATSWTNKTSAPAYQNQPPSAVAPIPVQSLISGTKLNSPRLPDDVYTQLAQESLTLATETAHLSLTSADLLKLGLSAATVPSLYDSIRSSEGQYTGRPVTQVGPSAQLTESDASDAVFSTEIYYGPVTSDPNGSSLTENASLQCSYHLSNNHWVVSGLILN